MALTTLSRSMHPDHLTHLPDEVARVRHARNLFAGLFQDDHEYRIWEYSICLAAFGSRSNIAGKRVLDVGGGFALLSPLLAWSGAHVTVNDVSDHGGKQAEMARRALETPDAPGGSLDFVQGDFTQGLDEKFDAVLCISVIEHVKDDETFFASLKAAVRPGGFLVMTTDFDPSGSPFCTAHVRTYTQEILERWGNNSPGFVSEGGYDYYGGNGRWVLGYNFASLVLRRQK